MHSDASVSDEFPIQAPAPSALQLHSALADGRRSDMDNLQVYNRHKDVRLSSHQRYSELQTSDRFDDPLAYPGFGLRKNMIFPKYELKLYFLVEHNF